MPQLKPITVQDVKLHPIALPLVETLRTSFGEEPYKAAILAAVHSDTGIVGWGEASVEINPGYSSETMGTAQHIIANFLAPKLVGQTLSSPTQVPDLFKAVRGHPLAKHALETAVWDAIAQNNDMRLVDLFARFLPEGNESRGKALVGVSIGMQSTLDETLAIIGKRLKQGYGRIKLKIQPGWDVEFARGVRAAFPDILLMLDANSAYTLDDAEHLAQLDAFNLLMIEQPLGYNDIYEHSKLQPLINTPLCLDESIKSVSDMRLAMELGACDILNLKPGRVGGFTESLALYRICKAHDVPLWIGGMLETGVGRAANVALASLPGVTLPCDISATDRYFDPDITEPPFVLGEGSTLAVPDGYGIGVIVQQDRVQEAVTRWHEKQAYSQ